MSVDLEILHLTAIPLSTGILYVYPEFVELTDIFASSFRASNKKLRGSRDISLVTVNEFSYVAKQERLPTDHYRTKFRISPEVNLALKEISIARVLDHKAIFEDEHTFVCYEAPYGFYENNEGQRSALFQWYSPINETTQKPQGLQYFISQLPLQNALLEQRLSEKDKEFPSVSPMVRQVLLELKVEEVYFPSSFAELVLLYNGVKHNEVVTKSPIVGDLSGKTGRVLLDFEFCNLEAPNVELEKLMHLCLLRYATTENEDLFNESQHVLYQEPLERSTMIQRMLREAKPHEPCIIVAARIESYLQNSGYFSGNIHTFGPAYDTIRRIPQITLKDCV
ncbi:MAG: hypothetical protein WC254_07000 [Candidatus Woesearchaeota archaeon]|jgi:hypothetical protein